MKFSRILTISGVVACLLSACDDSPQLQGAPQETPESPQPVSVETDYRFSIGTREFDPDPGVPPDLVPRVEESISGRQAGFAGAPDAAYLIIQFHDPLDRATNQLLAGKGSNILDRINAHTWIASANVAATKLLPHEPAVRWADLYPEDAKQSAEVQRPRPFEWQTRPNDLVAYSVLFHNDVAADEVDALPGMIQGLILEDFNAPTFPVLNTATVLINPGQLGELASIPAVLWIEPLEPPLTNQNLDSAQPASRVDVVQAAPYDLTGRGITVGVWESGAVIDTTPLDLSGRIIVQANQIASSSDHAVHIAGTVGASGANVEKAEGMAPQVTIASWDAAQDTSEMTDAANSAGDPGDPTPISASNHSYGAVIGWNPDGSSFFVNQMQFGRYTNTTYRIDRVVYRTDLIVSVAAGNHRNDAPPVPVSGQPADCFQGNLGYAADCLSPRASGKNVLTVGATHGVDDITSFSSFGPTNDGRIKPDVMAHGLRTLSLACNCFDDSNGDGIDDVADTTAATDRKSGTSMATAVVTGVVALLLEEAESRGIDLTAAGMKALLIQTAQDMSGKSGSTEGPDFASGWGVVDAQAAADLLRLPDGSGVVQDSLADAGPENAFERKFHVAGGKGELRVTLAWTDLVGRPTGSGDDSQLKNDLDLRLIAPDGTVYEPWTLDHQNPGKGAVRNGGDDTRNNVEQVSVLSPAGGEWTARVSAKADGGYLVLGPQSFALAGPLSESP